MFFFRKIQKKILSRGYNRISLRRVAGNQQKKYTKRTFPMHENYRIVAKTFTETIDTTYSAKTYLRNIRKKWNYTLLTICLVSPKQYTYSRATYTNLNMI